MKSVNAVLALTPVWRLKDGLSVLESDVSGMGAPSTVMHLSSPFPSLQGPSPFKGLAVKVRPVFTVALMSQAWRSSALQTLRVNQFSVGWCSEHSGQVKMWTNVSLRPPKLSLWEHGTRIGRNSPSSGDSTSLKAGSPVGIMFNLHNNAFKKHILKMTKSIIPQRRTDKNFLAWKNTITLLALDKWNK